MCRFKIMPQIKQAIVTDKGNVENQSGTFRRGGGIFELIFLHLNAEKKKINSLLNEEGTCSLNEFESCVYNARLVCPYSTIYECKVS